MATPRKTVYVVLNNHDPEQLPEQIALVRAGSRAQAVNHIVRGAYSAKPASIDEVVRYMMAHPEDGIQDAGEDGDA